MEDETGETTTCKFSYQNFEDFIIEQLSHKKADMLTECLRTNFIIIRNEFYFIDKNVVYKKLYSQSQSDIKKAIIYKISNFIGNSFEQLTTDDKAKLKTIHGKSLNKLLSKNDYITEIMPQILGKITNDDVVFNTYKHKVHFTNGYMDLEDLEFKKRIPGEDFITKYIDREYEPSSEAQKQKLFEDCISKIYFDAEDREVILRIIGRAIAGLIAQ